MIQVKELFQNKVQIDNDYLLRTWFRSV